MNNEEKDLEKVPLQDVSETEPIVSKDESREKEIEELEEDIIRNDTIPETSKDTPGSIGVFPVGAFDTSKD